MSLLTQRYQDNIIGVISCFDRLIIQGGLLPWNHARSMAGYLCAQNIKLFDFTEFAQPLRESIRRHAESLAEQNSLTIEFIRKIKAFRKEDRIQKILTLRGSHPGLVHIFSAMELCPTYKPWHDKQTHQTTLNNDTAKCLHYYFYFIDEEFGLCYLRVPTWAPFRLQFYCNGHNWLAAQLRKHTIAYTMQDNAFTDIADCKRAQELADGLRAEKLHQTLDIFARRFCPIIAQFKLQPQWTIMQAEFATDIIFKQRAHLQAIYQPLLRTAIHSVSPDDIASFLGRSVHPRFAGELDTKFNIRILGTRIKHHMGAIAIKMYDKLGHILRIETTVNDVSQLRQRRLVRARNRQLDTRAAPMKKTIYSLHALAAFLTAANHRYLEHISTFDDYSSGIKHLEKTTKPVTIDQRVYRGINFYAQDDQSLLCTLARGEFTINGFNNKSLRRFLTCIKPYAMTRLLKRLTAHGIIRRMGQSYRYFLTKLGNAVITAGLAVKQLLVVPALV
jgi:hypothetical protein